MALATALLGAGVLSVGCFEAPSQPGSGEGAHGVAQAAISGGYESPEDRAVVSIVDETLNKLCSGALIAPNLVLTARHCVAALTTVNVVVCDDSKFGQPVSPTRLSVSTDPSVFDGDNEYRVGEILVPETTNLVCGGDIALLVLTEVVPSDDASPYPVRLDGAVEPLETYSAIGFGGVDETGKDNGVRRRVDDQQVGCVGTECVGATLPENTATEWIGFDGICIGDSGGPAVDASGEVFGVTSRGTAECRLPVYSGTVDWAPLIRDAGIIAAGAGEYEPGAWTDGSSLDPHHFAPVGKDCGSASDCYTGICAEGEGGDLFCSRPCDADHACPQDSQCVDDVCTNLLSFSNPPTRDDDGCSLGRAALGDEGQDRSWLLGIAFCALAMAGRRRRHDPKG